MSPHLLRKFLNHGKFLGGWRWVQENYICKQNISCSRAAALVAPWSRLVLLPPSGIFPFTPALLSPTNVQKQTTLLLIALRGAPDARQTPGSIIFFGLGRAGGLGTTMYVRQVPQVSAFKILFIYLSAPCRRYYISLVRCSCFFYGYTRNGNIRKDVRTINMYSH